MVTCDISYDEFDKKFTTVLNKHSPKKKICLRGNPILTKLYGVKL